MDAFTHPGCWAFIGIGVFTGIVVFIGISSSTTLIPLPALVSSSELLAI
jgi:hypothetical protein